MKARVIVTKKCNRRCPGCCNRKHLGNVDKVAFDDLFKYDEISITGGEPMMVSISARVVEMVHRLKMGGYKGKIWLYTAYSHKVETYWGSKMLVDEVDGITYTLHYSSDMKKLRADLTDLRKLDHFLRTLDRAGKSDRLYIDSRVYDQEYVDSLKYNWAVVKPLEWKKDGDCPLPEGEELVFYDLEAEG
jgi:organic radical activating enzyme